MSTTTSSQSKNDAFHWAAVVPLGGTGSGPDQLSDLCHAPVTIRDNDCYVKLSHRRPSR